MTLLGKMVASASANGSGEFIRDGIYTFLVERIFEQKGYEGECCIAEFRVVSAEPLDDKVKPNAVGSTCSVVYNATKNRDAALGNIKKLIMGLYGCAEDDVTDEAYADVVGDPNPTRGMLIGCRTKKVTNKGKVNPANRGMIMTVPSWETVEQEQEAIDKRRGELDSKDKEKAAAKPAATETAPAAKSGKLAGILGKNKPA